MSDWKEERLLDDHFGLARDSRRGSELLERLHQGVSTKERGAPTLQVGDADERPVCCGRHGGNCVGGGDGSLSHDVVGARGWRRGGVHGQHESPRKASDVQVSGSHYAKYKIQPSFYIEENNLSWCQGNIIKYATRYKDKGGKHDLAKVIHYAMLILEREYGTTFEEVIADD